MSQRLLVSNVKISGTGSCVPSKKVTNADLEERVNTTNEWIYKNLGIKERRIADKSQSTSDFAIAASLNAMGAANLNPRDLDLIILATATPDRIAPATAPKVQAAIGAVNAAAFDLNAVCSGFIYALTVGSQFIAAGNAKNVLVIGADTFSRIVDWEDRSCVFFGDGAGAVVLTRSEEESLLCAKLYADGRGYEHFTVPAGGSETPVTLDVIENRNNFFRMHGREVYNTATIVIPEALASVLKMADLRVEDIDHVVPHQPSINILKESAKRSGIPFSKFGTNMDKYANTSSATIPLLLDEMVRGNIISKGDLCAFVAVGAGWTWGAALVRW